MSFSRGSSLPKDQTQVSHTAGGFLGLPRWLKGENSFTVQETWVQSLGWEDPLEKEMATHSSILAWKNPMGGGAWKATIHGSQRHGQD